MRSVGISPVAPTNSKPSQALTNAIRWFDQGLISETL